MTVNLDALIRYHTIDQCLRDRSRCWTWEALSQACFETLNDVNRCAGKNTISKRTIEYDIYLMRGNAWGYNAPIICKHGQYFYKDSSYSIKKIALGQHDIYAIALAAKALSLYEWRETGRIIGHIASNKKGTKACCHK